ncbi:hypothetical protein CEQ90_19545 [Lewinellaceae bacterium SD302]|nr:hypothetical protein CEQ90_20225 [Lewinellaceae bacterium SD302]PHI18122.1 hypothetical protein CEQ90_19545 [Lewinellaceae bacterium SD302]
MTKNNMKIDLNEIESMKRNGASFIETVRFVTKKYHCSINEANELILNSPSWEFYKKTFCSLQDQFQSCLSEMADRIEEKDEKISYIFDLESKNDAE